MTSPLEANQRHLHARRRPLKLVLLTQGARVVTSFPGNVRYEGASALTNEFLKGRPDAIRRLRDVEPAFYKFTPSLIIGMFPDVNETLRLFSALGLQNLCRPKIGG
jgi:hypothetical protein